MPRSFKNFKLPAMPQNFSKDPRVLARAVLGVLLLANLIAAFAIFRPVGGSAEQLDQQLGELAGINCSASRRKCSACVDLSPRSSRRAQAAIPSWKRTSWTAGRRPRPSWPN